LAEKSRNGYEDPIHERLMKTALDKERRLSQMRED
jgi:hypothetical protein